MTDHFYDFESNPRLLSKMRSFLEDELCAEGKEKFAVVFNQLIDSKVRITLVTWASGTLIAVVDV